MKKLLLEELISVEVEDLFIEGVTITEEVFVNRRTYKEREFTIESDAGRVYVVAVKSVKTGDCMFNDTFLVKQSDNTYAEKPSTFELELD